MALEADPIDEKHRIDFNSLDIAELRYTIIGNDQLKTQLMKHPDFLKWMHLQLTSARNQIINGNENPKLKISVSSVSSMHELIVIMWLIFMAERLPTEDVNVHGLGACVTVLVEIIEYILNSGSEELYNFSIDANPSAFRALEECLTYSFYIILSYENHTNMLNKYVSNETLWKFTMELVSRFDAGGVFFADSCMLAALKLVPYLLDQQETDSGSVSEFNDIGAILKSIIQSLKLKIDTSCSNFYRHALGESPNRKERPLTGPPPKQMLENHLDFSSTTALIVAAAQILNYIEDGPSNGPATLAQVYAYSEKIFFDSLLALYGPNNTELLNVALLNISRIYLSCLAKERSHDEMMVNSTFEYLFPRINWILKSNAGSFEKLPKFIRRPIAVLSDLCLSYPEACIRIKNSNVDTRIMTDLRRLFSNSKGFKYLHDLKLQSGKGKEVVDFTNSASNLNPNFASNSRSNLGSNSNPNLNSGSFDSSSSSGFPGSYALGVDTQMDSISDHILLLSVYTSSLEDCRRRITDFGGKKNSDSQPNFLCFLVCEIVENYHFLCLQLLLNQALFRNLKKLPENESSRRKWCWLSRNISQLLYLVQHSIYTNIFYLLRSLSRSVSSVETFFVDCNSIKSTYDQFPNGSTKASADKSFQTIFGNMSQRYDASSRLDASGPFLTCLITFLSNQSAIGYAITFFSSAKEAPKTLAERVRKDLYNLTTMVLGCLANFCLDFGPFRKIILEDENFMRDLSKLFNRSLRDKIDHLRDDHLAPGDLDALEWQEISYEQLQAQIGIFQIIQNLLYNETEENRRLIWDHIPLALVFNKSLYGISLPRSRDPELHKLSLRLKVISFAIMRNLTVSSTFFCRCISSVYRKYVLSQLEARYRVPPTWNDYLLDTLLAFDLYLPDVARETAEGALTRSDEFLLSILKVPEYHSLFVAVAYLEDNRHISIGNFTTEDLPSCGMMRFWKRVLQIHLLPELEKKFCRPEITDRISFSVKLVDVKLAIVWNLINLLFEEGDQRSTVSDNEDQDMGDSAFVSVEAGSGSGGRSGGDLRSGLQLGGLSVLGSGSAEFYDSIDVYQDKDIAYMSTKARAQFLFSFGFQDVLFRLIQQLSTPVRKYPNSGKYGLLRRFDNINSNDLLDKLRTAYRQIMVISAEKTHEQIDQEFKGTSGLDAVEDTIMDSIVGHRRRDVDSLEIGQSDNHDPFNSDDEEYEPWIH